MVYRLRRFYARLRRRDFHRRVEKALALNRGEVRRDGLCLKQCHHRLELEWRARQVHPWDRGLPAATLSRLFVEQCLQDTERALKRLFNALPEIDAIDFKVREPLSEVLILTGSVRRGEVPLARAQSSAMRLKQLGVSYRLQNWQFQPLH